MSLPEIRCVTKCATEAGYRRLLIGFVVALTTFTCSVLLTRYTKHPKIVQSTFSGKIVMSDVVGIPFLDGPVMHKYELFSSPDGAAQAFEAQIREAGGFRGLRYCHDHEGNELGRQVWLMNPPARQDSTADWRVIWALRGTDTSELFSVESDSLQQLQAVERFAQPNWRTCF